MEAIEGLFQREFQPMKTSICALERQMGELSISVDDKLQPVTSSLNSLRTDLELLKNEINENEEIAQSNILNVKTELDEFKDTVKFDMKSNEEKMTSELIAVKKALDEFKIQPQQASSSTHTYGMLTEDKEALRHLTAMIQNMDGQATEEEAIQWLRSTLTEGKCPAADEIYSKGEPFEGRLFARFASEADRDKALRTLRTRKVRHNGHQVRCKPDLPVDKRFVYSVLFGLKYLLCTEWCSHRGGQVKVDMSKNVVTVKGEIALTISFQSEEPHIQYEQGWNEWLQGQLWKDLVDSAQDRYKKATGTGAFNIEDPLQKKDPWSGTGGNKGAGEAKGKGMEE